jgi:tetratricopeptide (TPR) repeat protein
LLFSPTTSLLAQEEPPALYVPRRQPTQRELDRLEAVRLYAAGLVQERSNQLLEALHSFERAARLDPESSAVWRALIPLYLALDRVDDALNACRQTVALDPDDHVTWRLLARHLRAQNRSREAAEALGRALACPGLKDHPEQLASLWFDLGALHESIQDYAQAETAFRKVAAILDNPTPLVEQGRFSREEIDLQAADTHERLGRVCLKARRYDPAAAAFREAQKKDPPRAARLALYLAEIYQAQGKLQEALASLSAYLETRPQGIEAYEATIQVLRDLDRAGDIVPTLQRAAANDRHNQALRLLLAREYHLAGRAEQAEREYEELIGENPSPDVYRGLFGMYKKQGRSGAESMLTRLNRSLERARPRKPEAEEAGGDAVEAARARAMLAVLRDDPELTKLLLEVVGDRLLAAEGLNQQTRFFIAVLAGRARQLDTAERLYRSCLKQVEAMPQGQEAQAYAGLLRILWEAHKYEAIVEVCQQGLKKAQATSRVLFHADMARALAHLGKKEAALEQANAAVDHARDDDRLYCRRVRVQVLTEAERFDQAVAECQEMLREFTQPGDVRAIRYALSSVYSSARNYPRAEEQLQLILEADAADATACNDLGYIWADQGKNLEEAERLIRRALDLDRKQRTTGTSVDSDSDRENAAYVDSLGWVLFRRGKLQEARQELEKAARLPGGADDPVVWDHLGDVYARLNERSRARVAWQKAIEQYEVVRRRQLDERYREIKQKLKLLERQ